MYGKDYPYAQTRIQGTVLRIAKSGEPVYVYHVSMNGQCHVIPIEKNWGNAAENAFLVTVDDLDMHPVPLGYVNCAGEATYLMRIPMRRDWKQGLRQENCWSSGRMFSEIPMKYVKHCIMGKYPSFEKVLKDVKVGTARGRQKLIAWHRHWAVSTGGQVYYKNHEPVGEIKGDAVELAPNYTYLKEALAESMA